MWYFRSPEIVFGAGALDHLAYLKGTRAFIVTDEMMLRLGFVDKVAAKLAQAGLACDDRPKAPRPAQDRPRATTRPHHQRARGEPAWAGDPRSARISDRSVSFPLGPGLARPRTRPVRSCR